MIVGLLLAAGESRRFGSRKLLYPLADGTLIGVRSAENLKRALNRVVAVVSPTDSDLVSRFAALDIEICPCNRSREGMGASFACGVRAAPDADGWVIALADMPSIQPATIAAIAQAIRDGAPIAAPVHAGQRGHPVGFAREYYAELAALGGDEGARVLLARDRTRVKLIPVDDPGIHQDIDTPEDLAG